MAENDKKNPYGKKAKLFSSNDDTLSLELVVKEGKKNNHYAIVEITTPEGEKFRQDGFTQVSVYEYGGKNRFSVSRQTGRETTLEDGRVVPELGRFIDGVVLNRAEGDDRAAAIPVTIYSTEESIEIIDRQAALKEGDDPASVYEGLGTVVFAHAEKETRDATNEFFGIKQTQAYLDKVAKRAAERQEEAKQAKDAAAEAPAPEAPAADAETDSKPAPRRAF